MMDIRADVERIVGVCENRGRHDVTMEEARAAWRRFSDGLSARWMIVPLDDEQVWSNVKEYLPGGKFETGSRSCQKCHGGVALPDMAFCSTCMRETLDWMRQTIHRAHHEGPLEDCPKNTCDAALKALGLR